MYNNISTRYRYVILKSHISTLRVRVFEMLQMLIKFACILIHISSDQIFFAKILKCCTQP